MKFKLDSTKIYSFIFYSVIFLIAVFFIVLSSAPHEDKGFDGEDCYSLKDSCFEVTKTGERRAITLPAVLETQDDMSVTVEYTIPKKLEKIYALCIRTSQQSLEVKYDDEVVYTFGLDDSKIAIGKTPGSAYNIIRLPLDSAGKTVSFKITAFDSFFKGKVSEIYAGTKAAVLFFLLKENLFNLIIAGLILILGVALIVSGFLFKKVLHGDRQMRCVGWFSFLVGVWLFSESKTVQFFIGNQILVYFLAIISLLIMAIPILQYLLTIEGYHFKKLLSFCIGFLYWDTAVIILLQLTNTFQFYEMLFWIQASRILVVAVLLVTFWLELFKYKNKRMWTISVAVLALGLGAILEFVKFQVARGYSVGTFMKLGTFAFVIILTISAVKRSIYISELSREARYYQRMAKTDLMTKTKNRSAYIEDFEALSKTDEWKSCAVIIADINDLKEINDYYGHHMGDDAIIRCSKCLIESFGAIGECYRIGGDEFACIIKEHSRLNLEQFIIGFESRCAIAGKDCSYAFEVAAGYGFYEDSMDIEFEDIPKKADRNMYKRKQALKICKDTVVL